MSDEQERLLETATGGRKVQPHVGPIAVVHCDLTALLNVPRLLELHPEQLLDPTAQELPPFFRVLARDDLVAEVPQHLGRPPLSKLDTDRAGIEPRLVGREAGHGWKKCDTNSRSLLGNRHSFR